MQFVNNVSEVLEGKLAPSILRGGMREPCAVFSVVFVWLVATKKLSKKVA